MTVGPTLHYSHSNVRRCWFLALAIYIVVSLLWAKITGSATAPNFSSTANLDSFRLGSVILAPISIYQYPWQIMVLGAIMGVLAVTPVIVSQLLSFRYSIPMILSAVFAANLPIFGAFLTISCIAVACRPLRFRSRFIAVVLCMAPQMAYWAIYGGVDTADPIRWGFSYAPWICAWFTGVIIATAIIGIGHYTRYRPGLVWSVTAVFSLIAFAVFQAAIGFSELDYRLYVAENNPETIREFHDADVSEVITQAMAEPTTKSFLEFGFWSINPDLLREELKNDIQRQLNSNNQWPLWFEAPQHLDFQSRRISLMQQYNKFIDKRQTSNRMPIALYYKAMLNELTPDTRQFIQKEVLHFYSDYPHRNTLPVWYQLFKDFPLSPESTEARYRIAVRLAGQGDFESATDHCQVAQAMIKIHLDKLQKNSVVQSGFATAFTRPEETVMTSHKLDELNIKVQKLIVLIGVGNRTEDKESEQRLARFVILNPHSLDYDEQLETLLSETDENDPLRDNILLARILPLPDSQSKQDQLKELSSRFANTDGGVEALYELAMLKIHLQKVPDISEDDKIKYITEGREILTRFIEMYPQSILTSQAKTMLERLPAAE